MNDMVLNEVNPPAVGNDLDTTQVQRVFDGEITAATEDAHAEKSTCRNAAEWLKEPDEPDDPLVHELIECGEMVAVVGQSKAGKSFYALQMGVCIATGIGFLGRTTERRRVYIANLEVSGKQYKKRLRRLCNSLGAPHDQIDDWLFVDSMKGETATWQWCLDEAVRHKCSVVIIDPFYQIFRADENDATAINDAIAQMKVFQKRGITLIIVYHSPKGFSGDRQLIDMISGSSILARFPETIIGLLNHATHDDCRVVKSVLRNYAQPDDQTIKMENGVFVTADDIDPIAETSLSRMNKNKQKPLYDLDGTITDVLHDAGKALSIGTLAQDVIKQYQEKHGTRPGRHFTQDAIKAAGDHGIIIVTKERMRERGGAIMCGLPDQMQWYTHPEFEMKGGAR